VEIVRHFLPVHLRAKHRVAKNQVLRDDPGTEDLPLRIDVVEEKIECAHALLEPARQDAPFRTGQDAWNDVERDQPFLRLRLAINGKRDADAPE
jgi:hypothetical protein